MADHAGDPTENSEEQTKVASHEKDNAAAEGGPTNDAEDLVGDGENEADSNDPLAEANISRLFLPVKQFVEAVQDEGRMNKNKDPPEVTYPDIQKLGGAYFKLWQGRIDLGNNKSRASSAITNAIVLRRRHMDISAVIPSLRKYAKKGSKEKMYVIDNVDDGGQKSMIVMAVSHFNSKFSKKKTKRDGSIAIRVAASICHESVRGGARHFLSARKHRGDQDQSTSTELAFCQHVVDTVFKDVNLSIPRPDIMNDPGHDPDMKLDPINCSYLDKDADWFLQTWKKYLRPKYKQFTRKWNKDTGGGGRCESECINFCTLSDGTYPFLVWIYCIDQEAHGLLGARCGGMRHPGFCLKEAGFENNSDPTPPEAGSSKGGSPSERKTPPEKLKPFETPRKRKVECALEVVKASRARLDNLVDVLAKRVAKSEDDPVQTCLKKMDALNRSKASAANDDDLTPKTKQMFMESLAQQKNEVARDLINSMTKKDK
ncbi:hypothetical protein ACHAWF_008021 [Thalassiosira exigua]